MWVQLEILYIYIYTLSVIVHWKTVCFNDHKVHKFFPSEFTNKENIENFFPPDTLRKYNLISNFGDTHYSVQSTVYMSPKLQEIDFRLFPKVGHADPPPPFKKDHLKKVVMNGAECSEYNGKNN